MKKTISPDDRLRLVGREREQADHRRALEAIERSACALLGDTPDGHISDVVYGGYDRTADELLAVLGVTVAQPTTTPEAAGEQARQAVDIARRVRDLGSES